MVRENSEINNMLLSGYLREYHEEKNEKAQIPNLVTTLIGDYLKQYEIHRLGDNQNTTNISSKQFEKIIMDQAYNEHASSVFKTNCTDLKSISAGLSNTKWIESVTEYQRDFDELDITKINPSDIEDDIIDIKYGLNHILFLTSTGKCFAFGSNDSGQCGFDKSVTELQRVTLIPFDTKILAIACGEIHSLFIDENNKLLVCGSNYCGQLGMEVSECFQSNFDAYTSNEDSDSDSDSDSDEEWLEQNLLHFIFKPEINTYFKDNRIKIIGISCGSHHSLCITSDGNVYTFGHNGFYNLGNGKCTEWGTGQNIPYKLDIAGKKIENACCGKNHSILISDKNEIIVFGNNQDNQCSNINNCEEIKKPYILSKEKEFSSNHCYIEKVVCIDDQTLILVDRYKHIII